MMTLHRNPFRSERLRPGAIDFLFTDGNTIDALIVRLEKIEGQGEIAGPHGTGKSTLIQMLIPRLQSLGCEITLGTFCGGEEKWDTIARRTDGLKIRPTNDLPKRIVIIDGFEQLSWFARAYWKLHCRLTGHGLIVTTHRSVGLPLLYRTSVSPELAEQIVTKLTRHEYGERSRQEISEQLQVSNGNMRDVLFAFYDEYEAAQVSSR